MGQISRRQTTVWLAIALVGVAILAFFVRCMHLFNPDHFYMLSADSYFFHWVAQGVMAGDPPPLPPGSETTYLLHSGLAYPLAYLAKAASAVFGLSSADALDSVSKFLPPVLGLVSAAVVYAAAARICDRRVGLFAALSWTVMYAAIFVGAAGYVDRDGLSVLLIMIGAFVFYLSKDWRFQVAGRNVGWLAAGLGILVIEGLLFLEWTYIGPVLLLAILAAYVALRFLIGYADRLQPEPDLRRRLRAAMNDVSWRTFAVIVCGNVLVLLAAIALTPEASFWNLFIEESIESVFGETQVAEMRGMAVGDLLSYHFFYIPMAVGVYVAWKRRSEGPIFFSCWVLCMLVLSLFAQRNLLYAAPAASLLSGVGLAFLWVKAKQGRFRLARKLGVTLLLCVLVLFSLSAYSIGSNPRIAPGDDWQDALTYLRETAPADAVVMTWWDYGYWILDLGHRTPVVDNGYYAWDEERLQAIATAYVTSDPEVAMQIMEAYGADHLVFSEFEQDIASSILSRAGLSKTHDTFPKESLYSLALGNQLQSGGGLGVVYRSNPNAKVVILGLAQAIDH